MKKYYQLERQLSGKGKGNPRQNTFIKNALEMTLEQMSKG